MKNKRDARIAYYAGIREATIAHMETTEQGIRALAGLDPGEKDKILKSVQKKHEKLLKDLDRQLKAENGART